MEPFPVTRVARVSSDRVQPAWLVEGLWGEQAVGFIGGTPKAGKTWLALELAFAVASGRPCLGRFPVARRGRVLLYAAEDTAADIRHRVLAIAVSRGQSDLDQLPIGLITSASLRLDTAEHQERLALTIEKTEPALLVLDPLVRLHRGDENSAAEISALLGHLREIQRSYGVAIVLVHHVRKAGSGQPGQALRGSGDLHAWSDSNLYLLTRNSGTQLHVEHRSHPSPGPFDIELRAEPQPHLHITGEPEDDASDRVNRIERAVVDAVRTKPATRPQLRQLLAVRNADLGTAIARLEERGVLTRDGHYIVPVPAP